MFVLARDGSTYARLRFNIGPGGELLIPVRVDYSHSFPATNHNGWKEEYERNIFPEALLTPRAPFYGGGLQPINGWDEDWLLELEELEYEELLAKQDALEAEKTRPHHYYDESEE
jgi:hypothetical protein